MKPEKSFMNPAEVGLTFFFFQEVSRTLILVFSSLLAAISMDLKASALTNKQQRSGGQPHSSQRRRSRISQYQNNSSRFGGCFHPGELGAHVFRSQRQDKRPPS